MVDVRETKIHQTTKFLRHNFSDEEKQNLAEEMARKVTEADALEDQKKSASSRYTAEINSARTIANSNAIKITSGYEFRDTECEEEFDYASKEVRTYRKDTGEQVEIRTMTYHECQQEIFPREDTVEDDEEGPEVDAEFNTEEQEDLDDMAREEDQGQEGETEGDETLQDEVSEEEREWTEPADERF